MQETVKAKDARSGVITGRVRNVLFSSLALVAVVFAVVYLVFAA